MSEICPDKVTSARIFSHSSDSTDSDFIHDHIGSFFPPADPKEEVIEADRESRFDYSIDYVVDLVDDAVDMLVAGFAYVRDLVQTLGQMIVEWGMRVIEAIGEPFSAVVDPIVEGLKGWAEGIQEAMENFFDELAKWDDSDGNVDATINAVTELMLSFLG